MKNKGIIGIFWVVIWAGISMPCLANPYTFPPQFSGEYPTDNPGHPPSSYYPGYQFPPLMQEYGSNPYHDSSREKRFPSYSDDSTKRKHRPVFPSPYKR